MFLLKSNQNKTYLLIISTLERLGVHRLLAKNELKNIGISDIGKNPILCINYAFIFFGMSSHSIIK